MQYPVLMFAQVLRSPSLKVNPFWMMEGQNPSGPPPFLYGFDVDDFSPVALEPNNSTTDTFDFDSLFGTDHELVGASKFRAMDYVRIIHVFNRLCNETNHSTGYRTHPSFYLVNN
jgi:hypothetical protein